MKNMRYFLAIVEACNRAAAMGVRWEGCKEPHLTLMMDLQFTLSDEDVFRLNTFKDADFAHDIIGIQANFDRVNKQMRNCFLPRCKG